MTEWMRLECVAHDTVIVAQGQTSATFFAGHSDSEEVDDTARIEHALADWLLGEARNRQLIFRTLGLPATAAHCSRVVHPFIDGGSGRPGDIDLLVADLGAPHQAVAVEFKRLKARTGSHGAQRVNGLVQLTDALEQVYGLTRLGFSRTYLGIIVIAHDSSRADNNFLFRGTIESTFSEVVRTVRGLALQPGEGVLYVEIVQPEASAIERSAVVCARIIRAAIPREQRVDLTAKVGRFLRERRT